MDAEYEKTLTTPSDAGPQFRPAKGFLVVIGIFVVLGGLVLLGLGWLVGVKMPEMMTGNPAFEGNEMMLGIFEVYRSLGISMALIAIGFITLGIGSIALRKWARKLLLSWGWILVGFCGVMLLSMLLVIPTMTAMMNDIGSMSGGAGSSPSGMAGGVSFSIMMIVGVIIQMVFYLVVIGGPGALLITIYKRKNVELTTRYYHQAACWTDGKSIRVLILWLFYVLGILMLAPMFFGYVEAMVTMKLIPSIQMGNIYVAILLVALSLLAYGVAKLAVWAWWGSIFYLLACAVLGAYLHFTFDWQSFNENISSMSAIEGVEVDESVQEMQESMERYQQKSMQVGMLTGAIVWMAFVGYLFWIRKDFFPPSEEAVVSPA